MIYVLGRFICFFLSRFLFPIQVFGKGHIPKYGAFILASNHVSYLDPIAIGIACPRKLNFMARHSLFSNRFFAWILPRVNAFAVQRNSADLSALKEAMRRLASGEGLLLFPEGSRAAPGISNEAQPGVGFLAAKLNVPVIPAFVRGTEIALPKGVKRIKRAKVFVHFGEQIFIERSLPYQEISQLIMANIKHLSC
ncbi:MAG: lysophospholipid acyltransferase family protein [Candidatus Omnitrophica bacterium]|nr:lysophospholipid acyltransferase family protein [Candidatus Omnitrophota bacterium]